MTAQNGSESNLLRRLPPVRGRLTANAPIGPMTWFRVGGPAEALFRPADTEDLAAFLAALTPDIPVTVIGVGSNLLVRDGGIPGIVIRLGRGFVDIVPGRGQVETGAGALDLNVALTAAEAGIAGLEFLSGIPGTVGGGFRTNAGAYGTEFKDALISADALDRRGQLHTVTPAEMGLSYRHSEVDPHWIFVKARFKGSAADPAEIGRRMTEIRAAREASQPIRARTGGSINTGNATAADIEELGEEVRRRVRDRFGITLEWEIRRIGLPSAGAEPVVTSKPVKAAGSG